MWAVVFPSPDYGTVYVMGRRDNEGFRLPNWEKFNLREPSAPPRSYALSADREHVALGFGDIKSAWGQHPPPIPRPFEEETPYPAGTVREYGLTDNGLVETKVFGGFSAADVEGKLLMPADTPEQAKTTRRVPHLIDKVLGPR